MKNCIFEPRTDTSSATICKHCGQEKFMHQPNVDWNCPIPQQNDVREDDVDTPMVKRLKDHLNSITPEQFNKEIDDINKEMGYVNDNLTRLLDLYIEKTGYGMDMWSKEENAVMTTIAEIVNELAKENTYTEKDIHNLLSLYTDDAPASYIKRDFTKYLLRLKKYK